MAAGPDPDDSPPVPVAASAVPGRPRRLQAQALLAGAREVIIEQQGVEYHLRLTRAGKLILTK